MFARTKNNHYFYTINENNMKYKIKYFENKSQSIKEKKFKSYEAAVKWGKKNLENFNHDLINSI